MKCLLTACFTLKLIFYQMHIGWEWFVLGFICCTFAAVISASRKAPATINPGVKVIPITFSEQYLTEHVQVDLTLPF